MRKNAEMTKMAILNVAEKEFAYKGIAGARVDEIAEKCGVNKRMIYHYFQNKQGLYEKVILRAIQQVFEKMPDPSKEPPVKAITQSIEAYFDYCVKHPEYISLMIWEMVAEWETVNQFTLEIETDWRNRMIQKLEEGKQQKVFYSNLDTEFFLATTISQIFCFLPMLKHRNFIQVADMNENLKWIGEYKMKCIDLILRGILLPTMNRRMGHE